ncbi:MAG: SMC-Scp complex subunit ScpB [Synergistaceae bacterium]|jgi:segregation and condensation protein B|nr:SMC-Scp complex subunit ScpB [Synergistaceae bacterium]
MSKYVRRSAEKGSAAGSGPLSVLASQIEAVLFLAADPVPETDLKNVFGTTTKDLTAALEELKEHLASGHGLVLSSAAGGWVLETNPHFSEVLSLFREASQKDRIRLSRAAVETLSVIAWNQPVTRGEVEELRGVRSERVLETLLSHGLIRISGRKKTSGSPLLYRTTERFLDVFGVEAIADLPHLEELEALGSEPAEDAAGPDDSEDGDDAT